MKKHFYSHVVKIDTILISLDLMSLKKDEREELVLLFESSVHHAVVDVVLSELSNQEKKQFLEHLVADKHDEIWALFGDKTPKIEEKIYSTVESLKNNFHRDIKQLRK